DLAIEQQPIASALHNVISVLDAERRLPHHKRARLFLNRKMAIIRTTNRDPIVAGGGLDPNIIVSCLAHESTVGNAIKCHSARKAQVLGAGRFTQPTRALKQHLFIVVLNAPCHVLPMPHGWTCFPFFFTVRHPRLVEISIPLGNLQFAIFEVKQPPEVVGAAVGCEAHYFTALIPISEDVTRDAAVECSEAVHGEELVTQKPAAWL